MNKKLINLIVFVGLFNLTSRTLADGITAPAGVPDNFPQLLTNIASAVGEIVTTLGGIMIIYAGILYLLSAGSPEKVGAAKKAMIYAVAGIVIGLAATTIAAAVNNVIAGTAP